MIVVHTPPLDCGRPRTTCNRGALHATACTGSHVDAVDNDGESMMIIMSTSMRAALRLAAAAAMPPKSNPLIAA